MSKLMETFNQMIEEQREVKRKFQEQAQQLFKEVTKAFFDSNPGVTAVKWTQYTPYFNDGDTCTFGVNQPVFTNASDLELSNVTTYGEYEGEDESVWVCDNLSYTLRSDSPYYKETAKKIRAAGGVDPQSCDALEKMLTSPEMEDVLEAMFGDHVKVIATRSGFDVEEYDHE